MAFDVGGRLVLQDLFSGTLQKLQAGVRAADRAFEGLGDQADQSVVDASQRIKELGREIDALRTKARSGVSLTTADVSQYQKATAELQGLKTGLDDVSKSGGGAAKSFQLLQSAIFGAGAAFGALRVGQTIIDLTELGAKAETVQGIFSNLSENLGVDGAKLQRDLQAAARGTVDSVTLISTANRALLAGGAELAAKIPQLFEIARAASLATGQDINYVFETLVRGIVKASPLLIDNADIYIKIGDAVEQWAQSQGKATDALSETERRMAIANAVISQGSEFIKQMGLDSETAAEQVQTLPVAINELKTAIGGLLVELGTADAIGTFADDIARIAEQTNAARTARDLREELELLGKTGEADQFWNTLKQINRERAKLNLATRAGAVSSEEAAAAADELDQREQDLIASYTDVADAQKAALNGTRGLRVEREKLSQADEAAAEAARLYREALDQIEAGSRGVQATATALAQLNAELRNVTETVPTAPDVGGLFSTDLQAIRDYADEIERLHPEQVTAIEDTRKLAQALADQRAFVLQAARALTDKTTALDLLARAELGAGATAEDLAESFADLSDATINAAINTGTFGELFSRAVDIAAQKASGLDAITQTLVSAAGTFQALTDLSPGALKTPEIPTDLAFDASAWYEYLDVIDEVGTAQDRLAAQSTRQVIQAFEQKQQTILATAGSIDDYGARLQYLANELLGAGADVLDLVSKLDQLPASLRAAIDPTLTLATAIAQLRAQAEQPITISAEVTGFESGLKRIDALATSLLRGGLSPEEIKKWRTYAVDEYSDAMQDLGDVTEFEWNLVNEAILGGFQENVNAATTASRQIAGAYETAFTGIASSAGELKGMIESALKAGLEVTPEDMALAAIGKYEDKALESARRLEAVAQRGFAELVANPDWAEALKIPPEVLSGTEAELKAWASRTKRDVEELARPDLVDWDAFITEFQAQLDREAAKGLTLDIAVEKLSAAGLLSGSEAERKKKVAEFLGLQMPEMDINAMFKAPAGAADNLRQQLYGPGNSAMEVAAFVKATNDIDDVAAQAGLDQPITAAADIVPQGVVKAETILVATDVEQKLPEKTEVETDLVASDPVKYGDQPPVPVDIEAPDEVEIKAKLTATEIEIDLPETPVIPVILEAEGPIRYDEPEPIPVTLQLPEDVEATAKLTASEIDIDLPETPTVDVLLAAGSLDIEQPPAVPVEVIPPESVTVPAILQASELDQDFAFVPVVDVTLRAFGPIEYDPLDPIPASLDVPDNVNVGATLQADTIGINLPSVPVIPVTLDGGDRIEYDQPAPVVISFAPAQDMSEFLDVWLGGADSLSIPVTLNMDTLVAEDVQATDATTLASAATVSIPVVIDETSLADQAADAASTLADSFVLATTNEQVGLRVASAISADFGANADLFAQIGDSAGSTMAGAFVQAVTEGIGNVRQRMAEIIAPEVAAILAVPTGALP